MSKQCGGPCHKWLPNEYFDKAADKPDGLRTWCKRCRQKKADAKTKKVNDEAIAKVVESIEAPVLATLGKYTAGGNNLPHQTEVLETIIEMLGGKNGFAAFYVANILAASPGSIIRERMLSKILAAIQLISEDARVQKPRHLMSDEELVANLGSYGQVLLKAINGEVIETTNVGQESK